MKNWSFVRNGCVDASDNKVKLFNGTFNPNVLLLCLILKFIFRNILENFVKKKYFYFKDLLFTTI